MSMPKPVRARTWRPPLLRPAGPRRRRSSTPGRSSWTRSHPPPASVLPESAARKVSAPVRRAHIRDTYAAPGPGPATWKPPDPRRRSSRESAGSERACLPGDGGHAPPAACPVSTASRRHGLRRTCRLVDGSSRRPRSTWPDQARLPLPAVTHRYKRTHCPWLEQFQITDSALAWLTCGRTFPATRKCRFGAGRADGARLAAIMVLTCGWRRGPGRVSGHVQEITAARGGLAVAGGAAGTRAGPSSVPG
jgi:hypothetical protein